MAEHHAFWLACGARGVDQGGQIFFVYRIHGLLKLGGTIAFAARFQNLLPVGCSIHRQKGVHCLQARNLILDAHDLLVKLIIGDKAEGDLRIIENVGRVLVRNGGIYGYVHSAQLENADIADIPFIAVIVRDQTDLIAGTDAQLHESKRKVFGHFHIFLTGYGLPLTVDLGGHTHLQRLVGQLITGEIK